jgi:hypothetical protein
MPRESTAHTPHHQPGVAYDEPYTFGRPPSTYLATREIVRLILLRSKLGERAATAGTPRE